MSGGERYVFPHHRGRKIDHERPLFVRRPMQFGDEQMVPGQPFDPEALGVDRPRVEALFRLRHLSHYEEGDQSPEAIRDHRAAASHRTVSRPAPAPEPEKPKNKRR